MPARVGWVDVDIAIARRLAVKSADGTSAEPTETELKELLLRRGLLWLSPKDQQVYCSPAGVLLFSKDPTTVYPQSCVRVLAFQCETRDPKPVDFLDIAAPIPTALELAMRFIDKNTRHPLRVVGMRRLRLDEYPVSALREALVNAMAHRDYEDSSRKVHIELFEDRIEVISPGLLPQGLTLEQLRSGKLQSCSRNPVLSQGLRLLGLMEELGTGVVRMNQAMQDHGLEPPEYSYRDGYFVVTLRGPGKAIRKLKAGQAVAVFEVQPSVAESLNPNQKTILRKLLASDQVQVPDLVSALGVTAQAVRKDLAIGFLQPVAYLWTRTVRCKNPSCAATVPLVRQTWLCKKAGRFVALKMIANKRASAGRQDAGPRVRFEVVQADSENSLGFDPAGFSKAGNATCPYCGTVADSDYVKAEGCTGRMAQEIMVVVCIRNDGVKGRVFTHATVAPDDVAVTKRTLETCQREGITVPDEPIAPTVAGGGGSCHRYGMVHFGMIFTPRQKLALATLAALLKMAHLQAQHNGTEADRASAIRTMLSLALSRHANQNSTLGVFNSQRGTLEGAVNDKKIPMTWDFPEAVTLATSSGSWLSAVQTVAAVCTELANAFAAIQPAKVARGDAAAFASSGQFDAIITDPPYLDNYGYSDLSDFFYVWLKRSIGDLFPEHFSSQVTPKKSEAIADVKRHEGSKTRATEFYEQRMRQCFDRCHAALKPGADLVCIYAHKKTSGWQSFVDALRFAGFEIREAWPIATERTGGLKADTASLASSITLYAKKRPPNAGVGNYEDDVQPELQRIVRERVETLWEMGIAGADLVIACVGAGLRAFTKYEKVEYANGEEVPAEKFLAEVEGVVLDTMMGKLFGQSGAKT